VCARERERVIRRRRGKREKKRERERGRRETRERDVRERREKRGIFTLSVLVWVKLSFDQREGED